MKPFHKLMALAAAVILGATSAPGQAAAWPPSAPENILSLHNSRCIDADWGGISANGTRAQLWDCYGYGSLNQRWSIVYLPGSSPTQSTRGPVHIRSFQNGRCLEADWQTIGHNGTRVQLWDCLGNDKRNQQWYLERSPNSPHIYRIRNAYNNRCLDADYHLLGRIGTPLQLWDCYGPGSYNQYWRTYL